MYYCIPQTQHHTCCLDGLTTKCEMVQLVNSCIQPQCIDNQLAFTSFSTLDRLVVSIVDQSNTILDCAQLYEQFPAGAC